MSHRQDLFLQLLLAIFIFSRTTEAFENFDFPSFGDVAVALYKDVKFMSDRLEQLNIDAIFGLALTEANLMTLLSRKNINKLTDETAEYIFEILQMCSNSRKHVKINLMINKSGIFSELTQVLTQPEIWIRTIKWKKGDLKIKNNLNITVTEEDAKWIMFSGTPQEPESDFCLMELSDMKKNTGYCEISNVCGEMLIRDDGTKGYPLTHRLLFLQTALALNCKENPRINFSTLIHNYCEKIIEDLKLLESLNFPLSSRDLAMEQIFLCGMEGYLEFASAHYAKLLLNWPNSIGCYAASGFGKIRGQRYKRSTNLMDFGCDNHASGVAAATLSFFLRVIFENQTFYHQAPIEIN